MKLTPHPIFSEYLSLTQVGDDYEWREIARWIKFEENVEQGGNRWSKPYVSTLLLKSVFDLRQLMANAFIQLNLKANNFRSLTALLTQKMIDQGLLNEHMADKFQELLLKPRSHQYEHNNQRTFIINFSSPTAPKGNISYNISYHLTIVTNENTLLFIYICKYLNYRNE